MNPMSSFIFLFALITLHPHLSAAHRNFLTKDQSINLITIACERSSHKDFCVNVLNSNPDSQKSDLKQLAFIALEAASKNATATSLFIKEASIPAESVGSEPLLQQSLAECAESYQSVVELIDDSISDLVTEKTSNEVDSFVKAAIAAIDTCEASVKVQTGKALEVSHKNRIVRQLCNNALSIYHVVLQN